MTEHDVPDAGQLPATISRFLVAHTARDAASALVAFSDDPVVVDDGRTFNGLAEVDAFLRHAGSEFTYTTELVGIERVDADHWVVRNRLEGDFPGGVVDLAYRFTLDGDRIAQLEIAP